MVLKNGSKITLIKDNGILQQDENDFDFNINMLNKIDSFVLNKEIDININETIVIGSKNFICSKIEESIIKGNYIFYGHFTMTVEEIMELLAAIFIGVVFIVISLSIVFKGTPIPNLF